MLILLPFIVLSQYKERPSNIPSFRDLLNKSHLQTNVLLEQLSTTWTLESDETDNTTGIRTISVRYNGNPECILSLVNTKKFGMVTLSYMCPFNTEEDSRFYYRAVNYLMAHNGKKQIVKREGSILEYFSKNTSEESFMISITKYMDKYENISHISYIITEAIGI